ncbi:MAG: Unknown protein [uncultured Thiotrichaceae bacterium]|uniref:GTPase n=1 Tax=uncultured Thiotrichaceae bacterium TaxID=298394 RepID=A0A6S6UEP3_9GAMM|nr:MAG: Unknown protein [uncultured Thiotrichaceae bacterium]
MPDNKKPSSIKPKPGQDTHDPGNHKKPILKQQIKEQIQRIEELTAQLAKKEQELVALTSQEHLIEDLDHKLQETEQAIQANHKQTQSQARTVDVLTSQRKEKEQQITTTTAEQATLAHELSEKIQEVEIKLSATSIRNTHIVAQNTVKTHMIAGMSLGLLPLPLFDIAALTGIQLNLLRSLSKHYTVDFDEQKGKAVLTSLLSGALPVMSIVGLSSLAKIIPGIGTIGGSISITALTGAVVYATGQVFIRHFESGGTFQNFDSQHWHAFFKKQINEGRRSTRNTLDASKS